MGSRNDAENSDSFAKMTDRQLLETSCRQNAALITAYNNMASRIDSLTAILAQDMKESTEILKTVMKALEKCDDCKFGELPPAEAPNAASSEKFGNNLTPQTMYEGLCELAKKQIQLTRALFAIKHEVAEHFDNSPFMRQLIELSCIPHNDAGREAQGIIVDLLSAAYHEKGEKYRHRLELISVSDRKFIEFLTNIFKNTYGLGIEAGTGRTGFVHG